MAKKKEQVHLLHNKKNKPPRKKRGPVYIAVVMLLGLAFVVNAVLSLIVGDFKGIVSLLAAFLMFASGVYEWRFSHKN